MAGIRRGSVPTLPVVPITYACIYKNDLNGTVNFDGRENSAISLVKEIALRSKNNLVLDGVILDKTVKINGDYSIIDALDELCASIKCKWGFSDCVIYVYRDFSVKGEVPDISSGEIKCFVEDMRKNSDKLVYFKDENVTVGGMLDQVINALSKREIIQVNSPNGLPIGILGEETKNAIMNALLFGKISDFVINLRKIDYLMKNIDKVKIEVVKILEQDHIDIKHEKIFIRLPVFKNRETGVSSSGRTKFGSLSSNVELSQFSDRFNAKFSPCIQTHFINISVLGDNDRVLKSIVNANYWSIKTDARNKKIVDVKKGSFIQEMPFEYRNYFNIGNLDERTRMQISMNLSQAIEALKIQNIELVDEFTKKTMKGQSVIDAVHLSENDRKILIKILMNYLIGNGWRSRLDLELAPRKYFTDINNSTIYRSDEKGVLSFVIAHADGDKFFIRQREFKPPPSGKN